MIGEESSPKTVSNSRICSDCSETFLSYDELRCHRALIHISSVTFNFNGSEKTLTRQDDGNFKCDICYTLMASSRSVPRHKCYSDASSDQVEETDLSLSTTETSEAEKMKTRCRMYNLEFNDEYKFFRCTIPNCGGFFRAGLEKHLRGHGQYAKKGDLKLFAGLLHQQSPYFNEKPSEPLPALDFLDILKGFKCNICDRLFQTEISMKKHLKAHGGTNDNAANQYSSCTFQNLKGNSCYKRYVLVHSERANLSAINTESTTETSVNNEKPSSLAKRVDRLEQTTRDLIAAVNRLYEITLEKSKEPETSFKRYKRSDN